MISVLELKNKIEDLDKPKSLSKFIILFGVLPTLIVFPVNYFLNPNISPIVLHSPILLGLGFFAFTAMFLAFAIGGIVLIHVSIISYLAYRRFTATSILMDDFVPRELAKRIDIHIFKRLIVKFELIFDEIKAGLRHEISESVKDIPTLKIDNKEIRIELGDWKKFTSDLARRFSIESITNKQKVIKLEKEVDILKSNYTDLKSQFEAFKNEKSIKEQQIGENINAQDINENTKIDNENTKFKPRD